MIGGMQMPAKYYNWVTYSVSAPYLLRINSVLGYFYFSRIELPIRYLRNNEGEAA